MERTAIFLQIGLLLLLVTPLFGRAEDVTVEKVTVPESGVIFTEPSVDVDNPWDVNVTTTTSTSTSTPQPDLTQQGSEPESLVGVESIPTSLDSSSSITVDKQLPPALPAVAVPVSAPTRPQARVPPSFRTYIDEIRNTAAEIRWIKRDENALNPVAFSFKQHHHPHPKAPGHNISVPVASSPTPPIVVPEVVTQPPSSSPPPPPLPPVPTLPVPPLNTISAIIRDLEKQKRDYEAIKDLHPKLHLIPQKNPYFATKQIPRLEKPLPAKLPVKRDPMPKEIKSPETVPLTPNEGLGQGGQITTPSGHDLLGRWSSSGRWLMSWLGFGGEEGENDTIPPGPPYPYPHPPNGGGGGQPGEHPPAGQGFKYDCPFPHPPAPATRSAEKRFFFF